MRHIQEGQQGREQRRQRLIERQQSAPDLLANLEQVVSLLHLEVAPEEAHDRQVVRRGPVRHRRRLEYPPALQAVRVCEFVQETRLPHSRFPDDGQHLPAAASRQFEHATELVQLVVTADETGEPAPGGRLKPGTRRPEAGDLVHLQRIGKALHGNGTERARGDEAFHASEGGRRHEDSPRARELLHPRRQVRRLPDRGIVHAEIASDRAHEHLARIEPDPDLDVDAMAMTRLVRIAIHRFLHAQCGVASAHRMIFVRQRRAEQRHDAVPHHLVDGALVAVNRLHHPLEHRIEDLARFLGITIGE